MARFLVVASVNADRVWTLAEALKPGGRHVCTGVATQIGGAGWYSANAIRAAGHDVTLACTIGMDALGSAMFDRIRQAGIDTGAIRRVPSTTPLDIFVDPEGERTLISAAQPANRPGPTLPDRGDFDGVYVNTKAACSAVHCARPGAPVVVQMPLRDRIGRYPGTHVVVSRSDMTEAPREIWSRALEATDGQAGTLVITDGPDPLTVVTSSGEITVPCGPSAAVGQTTIGAGDTFAAHLLVRLGIGSALEAATAEAAQAASRWLATRPAPVIVEG